MDGEYWVGVTFVICVTVVVLTLAILNNGEPDLLDAIIKNVGGY